MAKILVVEDEASMRRILSVLLAGDGHAVTEEASLTAGLQTIAQQHFDLVITDQKLPDGAGLQLLASVREADPTLPVIMITAFATVDLAVQVMREGAFDFISKPFEPDTVLAAVKRACKHGGLLRENALLRDEVDRLEVGHTELIGNSAQMHEVRDLIERVARTDATVLIVGETGTGKEMVAREIHRRSRRRNQPFIAVNCAAMPEALLESQLFGHEKGAFTGADRARQGLFEAAHGGTLFLDEAAEMPLALQAKLLRVLMDGMVMRIGANTLRQTDVRILAATHRDLEARVRGGLFREDLYYRLAVIPILVPPLRQRREDVPPLAEHFLSVVALDLKVPHRTLSPLAQQCLCSYDFPGNVRELRNLLERAYILGKNPELQPADFPSLIDSFSGDTFDSFAAQQPPKLSLRSTLDKIEAALIRRALSESGGNQAEAARNLGISRSDMTYKLRKHELREIVVI
ncbi:MAG: sigma-54-dependent Fis family transcriptional regulator [Candidatus Hydrogenedentes bacterium]|nr:sigma-54-dependent Fis family transcriptional regulator [Candidatus Hydrogenedentota bacterium]